MKVFPSTLAYTGLNAPIGEEYDATDLEVVGVLPPEIEGVFFRAVPDPAFPPFMEDSGAALSADGMISAVLQAPFFECPPLYFFSFQ